MLNALPGYGHRIVATLEDGVIDGGFGEKAARFYGTSSMKVLNFGAKKEFVNHVAVEEQYLSYHLTPEQIVWDIFRRNQKLSITKGRCEIYVQKNLMIGMSALMVFLLGACGNGESQTEGSTDRRIRNIRGIKNRPGNRAFFFFIPDPITDGKISERCKSFECPAA